LELQQRAPTLFAVLQAAAHPASKQVTPLPSMVGMAAAILFKSRSKHMCLLQSIVATLLYAGHASKKVSELTKYSVDQNSPVTIQSGIRHTLPLHLTGLYKTSQTWRFSISYDSHQVD